MIELFRLIIIVMKNNPNPLILWKNAKKSATLCNYVKRTDFSIHFNILSKMQNWYKYLALLQLETQKLWIIEEQYCPCNFQKRKKVSLLKIVNHSPFNVSEPVLIRIRTLRVSTLHRFVISPWISSHHTGTLTTIFSRIPVKAIWKSQNISSKLYILTNFLSMNQSTIC